MRVRTIAVLVALGLCVPARAQVAADLGRDGLEVSGLTPGGTYIALVIDHRFDGFRRRIRTEVLSGRDEDGDGAERLEVPLAGAVSGLVVVADVQSGQLAASRLHRGPSEPAAPGEIEVAEDGRSFRFPLRWDGYAEVVLIRPGSGSWRRTVGDGAEMDRDAAIDGAATLEVGDLAGTEGGIAAVDQLVDGDVLVVVEPQTLRWRALVVADHLTGGTR